MKNSISRRDFLKLAGLFPLSFAAPKYISSLEKFRLTERNRQNVIIVVFDAFSAYNISLHGYQRETTPNLARLAKRAIVYHNHYSGSNFTTPGTASLLTGVLPWTHRGFNPGGEVDNAFIAKNIFSAFPDYYRIAYTHNGWANILLNQFSTHLDELMQREELLLSSLDDIIPFLFRSDEDIASVSWIRAMKFRSDGYAYSLFLPQWFDWIEQKRIEYLKSDFPRGLPTAGSSGYLLETAVDHILERLFAIEKPFLGYFHFLPPHDPYNTHHDFYDYFIGDKYEQLEKPIDIFAKRVYNNLPQKRREYDEFILYCDREFARLYNSLEASGLLENTWLVLTSDHGELNERGISGHSTDALYQPVVRVPLMIFEPGRKTGIDIYENTSSVDVLPTLAHLTGQEPPNWVEGSILPPFDVSHSNQSRNIYVMRANKNPKYNPLTQASTMLVRENYKLHYYFGYSEVPEDGLIKLFDLKNDPEEMNDLFKVKQSTVADLLSELKKKLQAVNQPYL